MLWVAAVAIAGLSFPTWVERIDAARAAADEAARAVVIARTWESGASEAQAVLEGTTASYGLGAEDLSLELTGTLERGAAITAHVTVAVPGIDLPLVGAVGSFRRTVSHTEQVDQYRSIG